MKILFRYVLREFAVPLFYCLAGFVSIYVLFELFGSFSRMTDAKLPLADAVRYFAGYLSPFFHYLAPAALMLAALYTMWNLSRRFEIVAMRASGVSLATVVAPVMLAAAATAAFTAWVDECYMPRTAPWAKKLRLERFDKAKAEAGDGFSYRNTSARRTWTVERGGLVNPGRLEGVRIACDRADGTREASITADKAEFLDGEWWLSGLKVRRYDASGRQKASPTPELDSLPLRVFPEFTERPENIAMQLSDAKYASVAGKLRYVRDNPDLDAGSRADIRYDAWSQAAAPFACIVIALLSVPAGMTTGRQAVFTGVISAVSMFFAYYGLVIACMVLAKTSIVPPVPAALLPPVLFGIAGVFHCFKTTKATCALLASFLALFALYATTAALLVSKAGVDAAMAHALAATIPAIAAAYCIAFFGRGASRT